MPLHLLGKKSWNVYNTDNVARVRRDEAEARAREEAEEQRMQQVDAERRLAILRGEVPPSLEEPVSSADPSNDPGRRRHRERDLLAGGRKRKRAGEDDTDFEMRVARERAMVGANAASELSGPVVNSASSTTAASLVDSKGHITLFAEEELKLAEKGEDLETEAAKRKREEAEQHQVRFTSAAGRDSEGLLAKNGPWYATPDGDVAALVPSKNVFGKEDPGRKAREVERLSASDPLAMMKRGAKMVREINKERERENEERERVLRELGREERRREKRRQIEHHRERQDSRGHGDESDRRSRSERRERGRSGSRYRHRDRHHDHDRHRERGHHHEESDRNRDGERSREHDRDRERRRDHCRDRHHRRSSKERDDHEHRKHRDRDGHDGHDGRHGRHRHHHRADKVDDEKTRH
ncbi:hypothetical protein SMACR_08260 [Sordaria macrospora]|uniref:CBF1-interacting co-repressor CIR N-terminal domain-containing protein n=1 Tax=Sordaria macrospora TaxID=5147 RepID=A0A8S8ZKL6_SORMA|nr:hypothetical protein SMACR_08260 [Sordaria macrospora]WPJ64326.1 hypothetical protein SMAC4_08260 [Sordaria macrospora]